MWTRSAILAALLVTASASSASASPPLSPGDLALDTVYIDYMKKGSKGWKGGGKFKVGKVHGFYGRDYPAGWSRGRKVGWYKRRPSYGYAPRRYYGYAPRAYSRRIYERF